MDLHATDWSVSPKYLPWSVEFSHVKKGNLKGKSVKAPLRGAGTGARYS